MKIIEARDNRIVLSHQDRSLVMEGREITTDTGYTCYSLDLALFYLLKTPLMEDRLFSNYGTVELVKLVAQDDRNSLIATLRS